MGQDKMPAKAVGFSFPQMAKIRVEGGKSFWSGALLVELINFVFKGFNHISSYRHPPGFNKISHKGKTVCGWLDLLFFWVKS